MQVSENKTTIAVLMQPSIFATIFVEDLSYKLRGATAGKAPKAWALPKFWVSIGSYKKQPVKKFWARILGLAWLKFLVAPLKLIFLQLFWEKVTYKFLEIRNLDAGSYFDDRFWRIINVFATIADYLLKI